MSVNSQVLYQAIQTLNLFHRPVCLHASLSSFGHVDGGAQTVVQTFLDAHCTVMVPSFSWGFAVPPPPDRRPLRNGWDYAAYTGPTAGIDRIYRPDTVDIDQDMGAIPAAVVAHPGRVRGNHPMCSFCAIGPLAQELITGQQVGQVYAPLAVLAQYDGVVILMGVDLTSMTLLHLAEQQAGRTLFRRWANNRQGRPIMVDTGGCSDGFGTFQEVLLPIQRSHTVGNSLCQLFPAAQALRAATQAIRVNPQITHCKNPHCDRCNDSVAGGPILDTNDEGQERSH